MNLFLIGVASAVVGIFISALVIANIWLIKKVSFLLKEVNNINWDRTNSRQEIDRNIGDLQVYVDGEIKNVYSYVDKRIDKELAKK